MNNKLAGRFFSSSAGAHSKELLGFGTGRSGQLGTVVEKTNVPIVIPTHKHKIQGISASRNMLSTVFCSNGHVYEFGQPHRNGRAGRKQDPNAKEPYHNWRQVHFPMEYLAEDDNKPVQVSAGEFHSALLTEGGKVWTWGFAGNRLEGLGGLGISAKAIGGVELKPTPQRVYVGGEGEDLQLKQVSCGNSFTMGLGVDGEVWMWGRGVGVFFVLFFYFDKK